MVNVEVIDAKRNYKGKEKYNENKVFCDVNRGRNIGGGRVYLGFRNG